MSRVVMLSLSEKQTREQCESRHIGISALETLPDGGSRLVCMSSEGAAMIRRRLKTHLIKGAVRRVSNAPERSSFEGWAR